MFFLNTRIKDLNVLLLLSHLLRANHRHLLNLLLLLLYEIILQGRDIPRLLRGALNRWAETLLLHITNQRRRRLRGQLRTKPRLLQGVVGSQRVLNVKPPAVLVEPGLSSVLGQK